MERYPEQMPLNLQRYKGPAHVTLSFPAVEFIVNNTNNIPQTVSNALKIFPSTAEAFFQVLHYNPEVKLPGGMLERPESELYENPEMNRHKEWPRGGVCLSGFIQRQICMLGVKHLPTLVHQSYGRHLMANKFPLNFQPMAWDCMQVWHNDKVKKEYEIKQSAVNLDFFSNHSYFKYTRKIEGF